MKKAHIRNKVRDISRNSELDRILGEGVERKDLDIVYDAFVYLAI